MLQTNSRYRIMQIDSKTIYIVPNFELCDVKNVITDIIMDSDSSKYKFIIYMENGTAVYENGSTKYYNSQTEPVVPFFLLSDEYIDNIMVRHNLSKIRKSAKITQKELSDISGLSAQCISNLESEDPKQSPTMRTVLRYLNCLGYEIDFVKKK